MNKYFDICATTPIDDQVLQFITAESKNVFGNPSSIHGFGQKSKAIIERARISVSRAINFLLMKSFSHLEDQYQITWH